MISEAIGMGKRLKAHFTSEWLFPAMYSTKKGEYINCIKGYESYKHLI